MKLFVHSKKNKKSIHYGENDLYFDSPGPLSPPFISVYLGHLNFVYPELG